MPPPAQLTGWSPTPEPRPGGRTRPGRASGGALTLMSGLLAARWITSQRRLPGGRRAAQPRRRHRFAHRARRLTRQFWRSSAPSHRTFSEPAPRAADPDSETAAPAEPAEFEIGAAQQRQDDAEWQGDDVQEEPQDHDDNPDNCGDHVPRATRQDSRKPPQVFRPARNEFPDAQAGLLAICAAPWIPRSPGGRGPGMQT